MKQRLFVFSLFWAVVFIMSAQENTVSSTKEVEDNCVSRDVVEENAEFPGGEKAMFKWLNEHIRYPRIALDYEIQGRVMLQFAVNRDGSIVDIKILKSPDKSLSEEAKRVVKMMPRWKPATRNGQPVRSNFRCPIDFRLYYIIEGRVVDSKGMPIKDVYVKGFKTNTSVVTGNDGIYSLKIPVLQDSVAFYKPGYATFYNLLNSSQNIVIVLDPKESYYMTNTDYARMMASTSKSYYEAGLKYLDRGHKSAPNLMKAYASFYRAANMENANAAYQLARMYDEGIGIPQDYTKAISWYQKAYCKEANVRLGIMYSEGIGVQKNDITAVQYFKVAMAQGDTIIAMKKMEEINNRKFPMIEDDKVFDVVEEMAEFPGGNENLYTWLSNHMRYPSEAREQGIQGRVIAQFVVEKDGSITHIRIEGSPHISLSKEAMRLIYIMPKWKPAMQGGKPVRSNFNLPVSFNLN